MTNPIIHDGTTQREMTNAEYVEWQQLLLDIAVEQAEQNAVLQTKQSARNKLKSLGLTDAEIAALVG